MRKIFTKSFIYLFALAVFFTTTVSAMANGWTLTDLGVVYLSRVTSA